MIDKLIFLFFACIILLAAIAGFLVMLTYVMIPYKRAIAVDDISTIADTIATVANMEFNIYDNNRFRAGGPALTSSTFDNYFKELSTNILNDLSPEFYERAKVYMPEDSVAKLVTSMVRNYLTGKLAIDRTAMEDEEA